MKIELKTNLFSCMMTSMSLTMLGCCNSLSKEISLMAVDGTPSSSDSSRIFFIATWVKNSRQINGHSLKI